MLKEFMLLTTIIFTTPEEERIDRHPFIDFAGVIYMKIIQKCVEAKDD